MSIFRKLKKNVETQEPLKETEQITEEEAVKRAKEIMEFGQIYILLSTRSANMLSGISIPYICQLENGQKGILLFSKEEYAKDYVEKRQFEILDGVYPIGVVDTKDELNGLHIILAIANALKVDFLDFNPGYDASFGCSIPWFMEVNELSREVSMLMEKEKFDEMMTKSDGNIPLHFNPIKINNFDNKYILDADGSKAILQKVFEGNTSEEHLLNFANETLFECCHTMDYLYTRLLPMAEQENKTNDVQYFKAIAEILEVIIKAKLSKEERLFTLADVNTDEILIKNNRIYILYTDRYKYMGQFKYIPLEKENGIHRLLEQTGVTEVMVTDGPHGMALIHF